MKRLLRRQGKLVSHETIDAARTALVVVDMQNYFVAEGFPGLKSRSRAPLCQTSIKCRWQSVLREVPLRGSRRRPRGRCSTGSELEVHPNDLTVKKTTYSAFMPASSDLDAQLKSRGIVTVRIAGTATNVCCETTARDAMVLDCRVIMLSDANATWTDQEHAATLDTFLLSSAMS